MKKVLSKVQSKLDARDHCFRGDFFQLGNENLKRPGCIFTSTTPLLVSGNLSGNKDTIDLNKLCLF